MVRLDCELITQSHLKMDIIARNNVTISVRINTIGSRYSNASITMNFPFLYIIAVEDLCGNLRDMVTGNKDNRVKRVTTMVLPDVGRSTLLLLWEIGADVFQDTLYFSYDVNYMNLLYIRAYSRQKIVVLLMISRWMERTMICNNGVDKDLYLCPTTI